MAIIDTREMRVARHKLVEQCRDLLDNADANKRIKDSFNAFTLADLAEHRIEAVVEQELTSASP